MKNCKLCGLQKGQNDEFCVLGGTAGQDRENEKAALETGSSPRAKKTIGTKSVIIILVALALALATGGVWGLLARQIGKAENGNKLNPAQNYASQSDSDHNSKPQTNSAGSGIQPSNNNSSIPGQTPTSVVLAAAAGDTQTVQALLDQGKDPNISEYVDGLGYCTALMASAAKGNVDTARLLINRGVDKNAYNMQGYDALAYAVENNNLDMAKLLIDSGANPERALGVATVDGNLEIVKLLLNAGANPNNNTVDRHLEAPLHLAASLNDGSDIILTLIQSGGNVNQTDMYGETPLFIAVEESSITNARLLLEKGANPNMKNASGETPLKKAQTTEMKSLLQSYGAQ